MGTYGWNFSYYHWADMINHENNIFWGVWPGMATLTCLLGIPAMLMLFGNRQTIYMKQKKTIDGVEMIPRNYGIHIDRDQPRVFNVFDVKDKKLFVPDGKGVEGWYKLDYQHAHSGTH